MSIELLQTLSLASFIAAGVFLAAAIIIFFTLRIPGVIGDVSGATARKAIEDIRQQNEASANSVRKIRHESRDSITAKITPSGNLVGEENAGISGNIGTSKLKTDDLIQKAAETTLLDDKTHEETTLLSESSTAETTVLTADSSQTTVLNLAEVTGFSIDYEVGFTGSTEIIE